MASLQLHHNFPKLAEESGFAFNIHKPRIHIEWNKINVCIEHNIVLGLSPAVFKYEPTLCKMRVRGLKSHHEMINIENLIRERRFVLIEQHINDILDCSLESEFDVRILDEGVLKIFRLSQLAVEYQQFCRNYLDRSVYVLREEVTNLLKELEITKKNLKDKDEEIRRLKRKTKNSVRTTLPYSNENIATMLLKTLNNSKGDIFGSPSNGDELQYNKCSYCDKVFLNQLYLKSHISRRHGDCLEIPQKDTTEKVKENTNSKLNEEIEELKSKLKQMEDHIKNTHSNSNDQTLIKGHTENNIVNNGQTSSNEKLSKEMKDAEVLTDVDVNINDKVEQWKKEEYAKYNQEIILLRKQIIDIISNKDKQDQSSLQNELKIMEQLRETIKEQGSEILALKEELLKEEKMEKDKRKEIETQMSFWIKQSEKQSNEYKALLQKLNEVANEAREYRAQADAEKQKSSKLEELLHQHLNKTSPKKNNISKMNKVTDKRGEVDKSNNINSPKVASVAVTADLMTLTKLQQKAQELLNINETSTCESTSSTSEENTKPQNMSKRDSTKDKTQKDNIQKQILIQSKTRRNSQSYDEIDPAKNIKIKSDKKSRKKKLAKNSVVHNIKLKKDNGYVHIPSSPMKVVRAKITEEVNQRLIALGVDPLKNRLSENCFQKPHMLLQKNHDTKTKKFPAREKILHSIIARLDQSTASKNAFHNNDYISPNKSSKTFSLSSVLTNVKTKALSLVKSNESNNRPNKSYNDVAKKAMALLKTPPGSAHSSPSFLLKNAPNSPEKNIKKVVRSKKNVKQQPSESITPKKKIETVQDNDTSNDTNNSESIDNELTHEQISKVVNNLVKSPIRHPNDIPVENVTNNNYVFNRVSSANTNDENESKTKAMNVTTRPIFENQQDSSDNAESLVDSSPKKFLSEENINNLKQTKGVLKNASSTSSLNKKKVLFDMEAIQMKSVSASPSQSITEKSTPREQFESGVVNLVTEEWDISSIENEPPKSDIKVQITSHTSPKIAELKKTIESQLSRRNPSLSTALVGGVDVLSTPIQKASFGGSNTSLGSSILDETDSVPTQHKKSFFKPKAVEKDDSEIEISDLINEYSR